MFYGVRDADGKLDDMIRLAQACQKAGINYPKEVRQYFGEVLDMKSFPANASVIKEQMTEVCLSYNDQYKDVVEGDVMSGGATIDLTRESSQKNGKPT